MKILGLVGASVMAAACASASARLDPATPTWRIVAESAVPDDVAIVKLFDDKTPAAAPAPVVTTQSLRRTLGARLAAGDRSANFIAAGLPFFGYLWKSSQPPVAVSLDDARHIAAEANVALVRDPASGSLHGVQPGSWELWVVDEDQLRALRAEANSLGVRRVVLFVKR